MEVVHDESSRFSHPVLIVYKYTSEPSLEPAEAVLIATLLTLRAIAPNA